jgi:hypothetical protein
MKRALLLTLVALISCTPVKPADPRPANGIGPFRGLRATPRQLAFTCVIPGCDSTQVVKVSSTVNRRVAVKRVVLSKANAEYTLTPSVATPFILGAASDFSIDVRYAPQSAPAADDLKLLVTYTDASPDMDDPERLEPAELEVPLVRRLVGEPALSVSPGKLPFGLVPQGTTKELNVIARNVGFGNISLAVDRVDAGNPWVVVQLPAFSALVPDAGVALSVKFSPTARGYYRGDVVLGSSTPTVGEVAFEVEGTSYTDAFVALEPEETAIDFGDVPRRQRRSVTVNVANLGGLPLFLSQVTVRDPSNNVRATLPNGMSSGMLASLQRVPITLSLDATNPGTVDATLVITSSDALRTTLEVPIRGTVTEPKLQVTPTTLAWGSVPMGWTVAKPIELKNTGFGALSIKRVTFVGGTSTLYTLKNLPALPASLPRDGRLTFEVEFQANAMSMFSGSLAIETDDPSMQIVEVPLSGSGVSCQAGCQVPNATSSCMGGTCGIASCTTGFYNTDAMLSNGCECREMGTDPSAFCSMGEYKGVLRDTSGATAQHQGMLPEATDVDWIRFYGEDANNLFSDDFDVRITLAATDPNITMCVYRHRTTSHDTSCYMTEETCDIRSYRKNGSIGSEDGADFDIKVYRRANSPATCTSYTVSMSNG